MSEENIFPILKEQCEVIQSSFTETYNMYDIVLDENIREPAYYRQAFHVLRTAKEGDRINMILNNSGGRIDSAICFRNLIQETQAEVLAVLEGETHSAASMIALSCHGVHVKPYASMMIHHASFGSGGTVQNVMDHVNFTSKQTERLIRDVYQHFLSESELDEVVRNREIWLTDEEIGERLDRMYEARREQEVECSCGECGLDNEEPIDLMSLIESKVAQGVEKSLDNLLKKYDITPKPKKAVKSKEPKVSEAVVENVKEFNKGDFLK